MIDYRNLLKSRVIILTGVGRSGTSILGKIIGSMTPAYYVFEPTFMNMCDDPLSVLFEDYFVPLVQGRMVNANAHDDSYYGNYCQGADLFQAWQTLDTREKAVSYIEQKNPKIVIKLTDYVKQLPDMFNMIPGLRVVHIIRNGNDVVTSTKNKGWYTKAWMKKSFLDKQSDGIPHFVDDPEWYNFGQVTRIAYIWRTLVQYSLDLDVYHTRYETLDDNIDDLADYLGLSKTDLTYKHIHNFKPRAPYKKVNIREPEREPFWNFMRELDY